MKKVSLVIAAIALVGMVQITECSNPFKASKTQKTRDIWAGTKTAVQTGSPKAGYQKYQRKQTPLYRAGRYTTGKAKEAGKWMEKKGEQASKYGRTQAELFSDWRQTRTPSTAHQPGRRR